MNSLVLQPMSEEQVEEMIARQHAYAMLSGFSRIEEMEDYKVEASQGMIQFGGSFTHCLGHALARADSGNAATIIRAFKPMCDEFRELYLKHNKG
jgi:hypothetical protein